MWRFSQPKLKHEECHKIVPHSHVSLTLSLSLLSMLQQLQKVSPKNPLQKRNSENCRNIETLLHLDQHLTLYMYKCLSHVLGNLLNDWAVYFFKQNMLFLILSFICSTANNVMKHSIALQQTGTLVDGITFTHKSVSSV
jgi:hypothetical protein